MKNLFYLFAIILFFGCGEQVDETIPTKNGAAPKAIVAKLPSQPLTKRDTTPTPRVNYIRDTGRSKHKIKAEFPYDIPLTNAQKEKFNSENVLAKNGKPTIVLFWLTTCYPCRMEMNAIKKVYPQWKEEADFNFVTISTDFKKNYENFIKRVDKEKWEWEVYHDTHREFKKVMPGKLNGLPQTFVFDKNGEIAYHKRKYSSGDEHKLFEVVKGLANK